MLVGHFPNHVKLEMSGDFKLLFLLTSNTIIIFIIIIIT